MTKGERDDLQRLVRQREKVLKSNAKLRSKELLADFENEMAAEYAFDDDSVWAQAAKAAEAEVAKAQKRVAALEKPPITVDGPDGQHASLESRQALMDYVLSVARKGLSVQRYKGLGEMNPIQLWDTTMNPATRTVLQVSVDDAVEADITFTTLMGDQVEPRRNFIEAHATEVKHLDV